MVDEELVLPVQVEVVAVWKATYTKPIRLTEGDTVTVINRNSEWPGWTWCTDSNQASGWVPDAILVSAADCDKRLLTTSYDATELTVIIGQVLTALRRESGWFWCQAEDGSLGWIPAENVSPIQSTDQT